MTIGVRTSGALVAALTFAAARTGLAEPECDFKGDPAQCFPYACLPVDAATGALITGRTDLLPEKTPGRCGRCSSHEQCGSKCYGPGDSGEAGTCSAFAGSPAPRVVRPTFHLIVADATLNAFDSLSTKPIVSAGYLGQIAVGQLRPALRDDGGFIAPDPPRLYLEGGLGVAFAGPAQNVFASAGLAYYVFRGPLALTTLSLGALYQRGGGAVWKFDASQNRDRVGPSLTLGFLQNVYVRVAYVFGFAGPDHHGAALVSLIYMRDLFSDLVSDRFTKYLPKALQGK